MNASRIWTLASIVLIVALLLGTWFVGISPRLAEAATANSERSTVETLNMKHTATLAALKKQFDDLPDLTADLESLRLAVPASADTANLLRQIHALAVANGVAVTELSLNSPERFAAPAVPPADAELAAALGSVTPENFVAIQVEQTVTGPYASIMNYIASLQVGERAFLVYDVTSEEGIPAADSIVEVSFTGQVFVLLDGVVATIPEGTAAEGTSAPQ